MLTKVQQMIYDYQDNHNLSLRRMSINSGIRYTFMRRMAVGELKLPRVDNAIKLAKYLGTTVEDLFGDLEEIWEANHNHGYLKRLDKLEGLGIIMEKIQKELDRNPRQINTIDELADLIKEEMNNEKSR